MKKELNFRQAAKEDLLDIITMLADDALGAEREKPEDLVSDNYLTAFENIINDHNQELTIVEIDNQKVGTFQLSFIQYLTHQGGLRAQVEAVRINSKNRGQGIGTKMFEYIIDRAKQKGCYMVQLTTDKKRPTARNFYKNLGFLATHEGMKLKL